MVTTGRQATWHDAARNTALPTKAFIDGAYSPSVDAATFTRTNPATGEPLATIAECTSADVDRAVTAAAQRFASGEWRNADPSERKRVLLRFAELIREHSSELALLETLDTGKPISQTTTVDAPACAATIQWYAETLDKLYDEVAPSGKGSVITIRREPVGVVAAVVPWNFPLIITSWKIGPALAAGNSVILKPAEESSLAGIRLGALAAEAGIPAGAFQVLPGRGHVTGEALGRHDRVDAIAFTGSTEIGKRFLNYAGDSNMKRVALECGGKSPQIITRDCEDLDRAAEATAWSIWYNQGETCHAGSRLLVDRTVRDALLDKVNAWMATFEPGDPLDPETNMGALIAVEHLERVQGYLEFARADGAVVHGGDRVEHPTGGAYMRPAVITGMNNDMRAAREEIFGPVLSVIEFGSLDEAIEIANDTHYGLAASIWTDRISDAHRAAGELRAGTVWINCYDQSAVATPFGGYKQSGIGRDRSLHAFDKYTEIKTTWLEL